MSDFHIFYRSPGELLARHRGYRLYPDAQIERLCKSISDYGFNEPVAIDDEGRIVCGGARVEAAKRLGLNRIPVICLSHLNPAQLRAYAIAANKLAEMSGYDEQELALEIADIQLLLQNVELPEMGFDAVELDRLLNLSVEADVEDMPDVPDPARAISKVGNVWQLGKHLLLNGDALSGDSYQLLMGDERAQFVISDPPYNLTARTFSTTGRHDDFCQGAGELDSGQFTRFLTTVMRLLAASSATGSIHMFFMSHHFLLELLRAGKIVYDDLKTIITWKKPFPVSEAGTGARASSSPCSSTAPLRI